VTREEIKAHNRGVLARLWKYLQGELEHRAEIGAYGRYGFVFHLENGKFVKLERTDVATCKSDVGSLPEKQPGDPLTGGGEQSNLIV
jgi:hypothetical protein